LSCCLPCPRTDWVYSGDFQDRNHIANYVSIISLVLNTFLLVTFIVIPREKSHRHYLSIGLTASLILIAIAFAIPLGTKPDFCHNAITPNNLKTDASCGATGVFLELGAMGAVVWSKSNIINWRLDVLTMRSLLKIHLDCSADCYRLQESGAIQEDCDCSGHWTAHTVPCNLPSDYWCLLQPWECLRAE
jgi:hypothetical protein